MIVAVAELVAVLGIVLSSFFIFVFALVALEHERGDWWKP